MKRTTCLLLCAALACALIATAASAGKTKATESGSNWAQWRGPDSQGVSTETNLPSEWTETKNVLWKTAIPGLGFSSPIIWGKKVFVTTAIEGGPAPAGHKPVKHMFGDKEFTHPDWYGADTPPLRTGPAFSSNTPDTNCVTWDRWGAAGRTARGASPS